MSNRRSNDTRASLRLGEHHSRPPPLLVLPRGMLFVVFVEITVTHDRIEVKCNSE